MLGAAAYGLAIICCGLLAMCALGLGRTQCAQWPSSSYAGTAFSLGSGLLGSFWLILADFGWLIAPLVCGIWLLLVAAGFRTLQPVATELRAAGAAILSGLASETWPWRIIALLTLCLIVAFGIAAFHPAFGDSVAFYLPWSHVIASSGRIMALPGFEPQSDLWVVAELHVAAVMATLGDWVARLLPYLHVLAAGLLVWGMGRGIGIGMRACLLAVTMLFTSTNVGYVIWDGKTDLVALPLGLAAINAALQLRGADIWKVAVLTGLLCGTAVAAKLSYVLPLAGAVGVIAVWRMAERFAGQPRTIAFRHIAGVFGIIGAAFVLVILPQLGKGWVIRHEPFAPFFYFGAPGLDTEQAYFSAGTTARLLLTYPLALTFGRYWAQYGNLSLLFLAFLPAALMRSGAGPRRELRLVAFASLCGILLWVALRPSTFAPRYFLPVLVAPFLLAADGAEWACGEGPRPVRILSILMICFVLVETLTTVRGTVRGAWRYASSADIESDADDAFQMARLLNASAAPGARVALLTYYRYPLRADLLECALGLAQLRSAGKQMAIDLYVDGADYLAIDPTLVAIPSTGFAGVPAWLLIDRIYSGQRPIYRLRGGPGSPTRKTVCRREGRAWVVRETSNKAVPERKGS